MGYGAAFDLIHNSPYVAAVTIADADEIKPVEAAGRIGTERITPQTIDAGDEAAVRELFAGHDAVISCVNYWYNESLSKIAIETGAHFCDLGGNNYVVDSQLALNEQAKAAGVSIIPPVAVTGVPRPTIIQRQCSDR